MSLGISYAEETEASDALSKFVEPGVIVLILVLNATVGVWMARHTRGAARRGGGGPDASPPPALPPSQESNAESALDALKEMQSEHAKTLRDGVMARRPARHGTGLRSVPLSISPAPTATHRASPAPQVSELPARELVPGDIVELRVGDKARRLPLGGRERWADASKRVWGPALMRLPSRARLTLPSPPPPFPRRCPPTCGSPG